MFPDGFYRAQVKANEDSESMARVQVRVYPHFDGIADADLPWAAPAFPSHLVLIPDTGSWVWCFFEDGDPLKPAYFGAAPGKTQLPHADAQKYTMQSPNGTKIEIDDSADKVVIQHADWAGPPEGAQGWKMEFTGSKLTISLAAGVTMEVLGVDTLPIAGVLQAGTITPAPGVPLTPGSLIFKVGQSLGGQ